MDEILNELKRCPKCGWRARLRPSSNRNHKTEYGVLCGNGRCSWSYACATFCKMDDAVKHWNERVEQEQQLQEWSKELLPCECGGKAELVYERIGFGQWYVRCTKCGKLQTASLSKEASIEGWNRRVGEVKQDG